jgi:uncharacterized membrane protein
MELDMASIFLINDNKIVSRLLQLSSEKHGYLLEEKMDVEPSREHYDIVLVDSDTYSPELIEKLKSKITFDKLGYIGVKKEEVPTEFDMHLDKPFLPSDFVSMVEENLQSLEAATANENSAEEVEEKLATTEETIDSDVEEELEALKELEDIEDLEEFTLEDLDDLEPVSSPADDLKNEDGALKDIEKTEDALKELEALDEELEDLEDLDLSLDSGAVMSTGIAEQYLEETSDEASKTAIGAAVTAAAAAGAEMLTDNDKEKVEEKDEATEEKTEERSELDTLEGSEAIEHESDYIQEELSAEELANEFDTLNEEEVLKALNNDTETEETETTMSEPLEEPVDESSLETVAPAMATADTTIKEEILHEEIVTEGEETMVESNDVEKWIRDAVAKAITPEMIKEALDGMEINVTLNFTKKDA